MTQVDSDRLAHIDPAEFEQEVRDCLTHLYDYGFLREHPLLHIVVPDVSGANQVQLFRQAIVGCPLDRPPGGRVARP